MKLKQYSPLTLALSCSPYPSDANLMVKANNYGYSIYAETQSTVIELGSISAPSWVYDIQDQVMIEIGREKDDGIQDLYSGLFFTEGRRAPSLTKLLQQAYVLGPDSHDYCCVSIKETNPVTLVFKITVLPRENSTDNYATITFSPENIESLASKSY